jgi:methyl acetate hydrolase
MARLNNSDGCRPPQPKFLSFQQLLRSLQPSEFVCRGGDSRKLRLKTLPRSHDGLNGGHLGPAKILSENSVKMMGENNIGPIFVELQQGADQSLSRPFPLGAGHDEFGLGFQIASSDPKYANFRSVGSLNWAGIYNTEFWIDPKRHIGVVMMIQVLPFYDDGAIRTLRDFEELVYQNLQ